MDTNNSNRDDRFDSTRFSRRKVLQGVGTASAIGVLGTGSAAAQGKPCFKDFGCEEGIYAKIEFVEVYEDTDDDGEEELVDCYFEEETDTGLVEVTDWESKEGEECDPISVTLDYADGYTAGELEAYGGQDCDTVTNPGIGYESGLVNNGGNQAAISNIQFCIVELCPTPCGDLLTHYAYDDETEEFVWTDGRDSLAINGETATRDGSEFDVEITETNDAGEPTSITFDSINQFNGPNQNPDVGVYEATCATIRTTEGTETVEFSEWVSNGTLTSSDGSIASFSLCINDAMWQADFGTGPKPTLFTESNDRDGYGEDTDGDGEIDRELIMAAVHGPPNRDENPSYLKDTDIDGVNVLPGANGKKDFDLFAEDGTLISDDSALDIGDAVEAEVQFEITSDEPIQLHIGIWEMPGPYDKGDIPWAPLFDAVEQTYDPGDYPDGQVTERVELPRI